MPQTNPGHGGMRIICPHCAVKITLRDMFAGCPCGRWPAWPADQAKRTLAGIDEFIDMSRCAVNIAGDKTAMPVRLQMMRLFFHACEQADASAIELFSRTIAGERFMATVYNLIVDHRNGDCSKLTDDERYPWRHHSIVALQKLRISQCCYYVGSTEGGRHFWCDARLAPTEILCRDHVGWLVVADLAIGRHLPDVLARICSSFITPDWWRVIGPTAA
jgi:hypothetical protein